MNAVKVGQVWRDKDKRRQRLVEVLSVGENEVHALIVGTEDETSLKLDRFVKRWELLSEKVDEIDKGKDASIEKAESEHAGDQDLKKVHETREAWLKAAVTSLSEGIFGDKYPVPEVRVSVGWPGGRGPKTNTIGQCWPGDSSADGVGQIFISPVLVEPVAVLETLVHELIHAINHKNGDTGHRTAFSRIALGLGLEGKMTATHAGPDLAFELEQIGDELGEYPHAAINVADKPKTQRTYMLKVTCVEDPAYFVRMTEGKIEEFGTPICPCHHEPMELEL